MIIIYVRQPDNQPPGTLDFGPQRVLRLLHETEKDAVEVLVCPSLATGQGGMVLGRLSERVQGGSCGI